MRNPVPIFGIVGLATMSALGGDLHFYVEPYQVYDGGAMQFHYVPNGGIPLDRIRSWAWDFDGDGTADVHGEDSTGINLTWYAQYDANRATNDVCRYT